MQANIPAFNIMKKIPSFLTVFLLLCVGCVANNVTEDDPVIIHDSAFFFRDSKFLYAGSFSSVDPYNFEYRINGSGIPASEYLLAFSPKDETVEVPDFDVSTYQEPLIFWFRDHHTGLEDYSVYREYLSQLKEFLFDVKAPTIRQGRIELRTEEIESIKITSNCVLFGRAPGEDLTDRFELYRTLGHTNYPPFYFTSDKTLVTSGIQGKSLDKFISERPLIPAMTFLRLKETPSEAPVDVTFTVSISLKDKAALTATAAPVMILRN